MLRKSRSHSVVVVPLVGAFLLYAAAFLAAAGSPIKLLAPPNKARVSGVVVVQAQVAESLNPSYGLLVVDNDRPGADQHFSLQALTRHP